MEILFIAFAALLFLTLITTLFKREKLPYYKKNFITNAELSFFKSLEQAVGNTYRIFPQVNLGSLVKVNVQGSDWWKYSGKINKKSVDFVIAEKETCKPILVIELDDFSHQEEERKKRDEFVNKVFAKIELPILHIIPKSGYSVSEIQKDIKSVLSEVKK